MDCTETYNEYAISVLETAFDVEDVIEGVSNDFIETEVDALKKMKTYCERFISAFDEYTSSKENEGGS